MAPPDDPAGPLELRLAYAGATLASLVWVGCVLPGAVLLDPATSPDAATPMARGPLLLLPALLLLVSGPVGTTLARGGTALKALLSSGEAFVTLFVTGAVWRAGMRDPAVLAASGVFFLLGCFAFADTVLTLRAVPATDAAGVTLNGAKPWFARPDVRLAAAVLALVVPTSLISSPGHERASLLLPFVYVAISSFGCRYASTERGLRLVASILLVLVAAHLVVTIRFLLVDGSPAAGRWTWSGLTTFALALGVLAAASARVGLLCRDAWRTRNRSAA